MIRARVLLRALLIGLTLAPILTSVGCSILYAVDDYASADDAGIDGDADAGDSG